MKTIDINDVYTLFEEIKELLIKKDIGKNDLIPQPKIEMPDLSAITELSDQLDETIKEVRKPTKAEHHHIIKIASQKVFFTIISLGLMLTACLTRMYYQHTVMSTYKDNGLKYRYVQMKGAITPEELNLLENLFENHKDSIKIVQKQVGLYEKALVEEAKRLEKARRKEMEAERLKREAEELKRR